MGVEKYGASEVCRGCSSETDILAVLAKGIAARMHVSEGIEPNGLSCGYCLIPTTP